MLLSKITMNFSNQKLCLESFKIWNGVKFKRLSSSDVTGEHRWRHLKLPYLDWNRKCTWEWSYFGSVCFRFAASKTAGLFLKSVLLLIVIPAQKFIKKHICSTNARSINQTQSACGDHLRACPFKHLQSKLNLPSRYIYLLEN